MSTCTDCMLDIHECSCDDKAEIEDLKAQVERLREIIRLNGICSKCGDGIQDYSDSDGNSTCGCKAKAESNYRHCDEKEAKGENP